MGAATTTIGSRASIGYGASIGPKETWDVTPLGIIGTRHAVTARKLTGGFGLAIGCEVHTIAHWLAHYEKIGKANGYSTTEVAEYEAYIRLAAQIYAVPVS